MLYTKIRATIISLAASASFGVATIAPAVAQAKPKLKVVAVTCPDIDGAGPGQPGESRTLQENVILPNGQWGIRKETKICGNDGKWHTVVDLVASPSLVTPVGVMAAGA
jgi:hypothetical protein